MTPRRGRGHNRYGRGSYSVMPDGRHRWQYITTTATGAKTRLNIRKKTLEELDGEVDRILAEERTLGHTADNDAQTLPGYLNEWLENVVGVKSSPTTRLKYQYDLQRLMPYLRHHTLRSLQAKHIQAAIRTMRDTPWQAERYDPETKKRTPAKYYAPATIERALDVLKAALEKAVEQGRIARNPARSVAGPIVTPYVPRRLSVDEAKRLLKAARADRLHVLYELMLVYGLRRGEVLGLRWQDIDLERKRLTIAQQVVMLGNRVIIKGLKTPGSAAVLPLELALVPLLEQQRRRILELADAAARWTEHDLVFPSNVGTPIAPRNLIRSYKQLLAKAKLPTELRFHDLRHSVASFLAAAGVHPAIAQQILRHADIRITMEVYTHVDLEQQAEAAARLSALVRANDEQEVA